MLLPCEEHSIFQDVLVDLTKQVDSTKPCEILMFEQQANSLWNILLQRIHPNAIIVGYHGTGKTALIEKITYDIVTGNCPSRFLGFTVLSLDMEALICNSYYKKNPEELMKEIVRFIQSQPKTIFVMDGIHLILGSSLHQNGCIHLGAVLKPLLSSGFVIATIPLAEYSTYYENDTFLPNWFEEIHLSDSYMQDVYPKIRAKIQALSDFHGVRITKQMAKYAIFISTCFNLTVVHPLKAIALLDKAMVIAEQAGEKYVDKKSIFQVFAPCFRNYENTSMEAKESTACHEAGHYVAGKASGNLTERNWIGISTIPTEDFIGLTLYESHTFPSLPRDIHYYIDKIAFLLAGRIAEILFCKDLFVGSSSDLQESIQIAQKVAKEFFSGPCSMDFTLESLATGAFQKLSNSLTDSSVSEVEESPQPNDKVQSILDIACQRAESLLIANADIHSAIVDALLENPILSEPELDAIWQDVVRKRKQ